MRANGEGTRRVIVRLEAAPRRLRRGEIRLLPPLSQASTQSDAQELPVVPAGLQDDALRSIHDLHRALADSNTNQTWWYLPVAEWQPYMSALPEALELEARLEALTRGGQGLFVLAVRDALVARYLRSRFASRSDVEIVADWQTWLRWMMDRLKAPILRWMNAIAWLFENARHVAAVRAVRKVPSLPATLDTLFVSRIEPGYTPAPGERWRDLYLGPLPAEGNDRAGSVALLLRCGGEPGRQVGAIAAFAGFPTSLVFEWLTLGDLCRCLLQALRFRLNIRAAEPMRGGVVLSESRNHVRALADWLLVECAVRNLLKHTAPRQIVCMQENSNWEFAVVNAARAVRPTAMTVGFFHCPVMPSAQRYRTRTDVRERRPNFGTTIPLGRAMREALLRLGDWEPLVSNSGYAFRNPQLDRCLVLPLRPVGDPLRLLVVLGGVFDNARFLAWVKTATQSVERLSIVIKPHPSFDHRAALSKAGIDVSIGRFSLSPHRDMDRALSEADAVIYKGTTVCFAALAAGIPAIHIGDGGIATDDALFAADGLSVSVADQAALLPEIERIRDEPFAAREIWAGRARDYVRRYYDLSSASHDAALAQLFPVETAAHAVAAATV